MSDILHEGLENFSGFIRTLYLVTPDKAPILSIKDDFVIHFDTSSISDDVVHLSIFDKIEFTMDTLTFKEEPVLVAGDNAFKKSISGIIPKDRIEVFQILKAWNKKRAMVLLIDRNESALVFGSKTEPAVLMFNRSNGPTPDDRNQYEITIIQTSKEPAAFCLVTEE